MKCWTPFGTRSVTQQTHCKVVEHEKTSGKGSRGEEISISISSVRTQGLGKNSTQLVLDQGRNGPTLSLSCGANKSLVCAVPLHVTGTQATEQDKSS